MQSTILNSSKNRTDYKELLRPYLKNWKWFIAAVLLSIILAVLKIRYSTPLYAVQAKIQILENQNSTSELGAFQDLGIFMGSNTQVEDEIEILNSRSNLIDVIKKLGINVRVIGLGQIHDTELYKRAPFKINFLIADSLLYQSKDEFIIEITSETTFKYTNEKNPITNESSFGKTLSSEIGDFVLLPTNATIDDEIGRKFRIIIKPVSAIAQTYKSNIKISVASEFSNVFTISLEDPVEKKGIDIINGLIDTYNQNAVEDKRLIANSTTDFINDRIREIYGDLSSVDQSAQEFKSGKGITDVSSQSNINLNVSAANQQELRDSEIQLRIATSMKNIVDNQTGYEVLPSNIGLSDGSIANTTARYNELVLERNRLLKSSNVKNPIVVNLDQQIDGLKTSLQSGLNSITNNLNLQVNNLRSQLSKINAKIYATPGNERALRDITRQQQTTEALYLYLLQKREESQITFASSSPKSKIIDRTFRVSEFPVSPKKSIIIMSFLILGMLLPFSVIYLNELLDNKVHGKITLEKYVDNIPVLAELPKLSKKENTLVRTGERTVLAESLRILRTNIDFVIKSKKINSSRGSVIFVTSTVSGEGKTLISSNLAMIFANANKKVLLIGADIRNPKIYKFYSGKNVDRLGKPAGNNKHIGLAEYLADMNIAIDEIISPMLAHDQTVDVIYSGKVPPNPSELLMSDRLEELLTKVSIDYDYVIVDTAPMMVVTDTLLISEFADMILYIVRANVTELKVLNFPMKLRKEGKLKGLAFVVNGVKESNLGYGGKYGYGYGESKKKWWKFG